MVWLVCKVHTHYFACCMPVAGSVYVPKDRCANRALEEEVEKKKTERNHYGFPPENVHPFRCECFDCFTEGWAEQHTGAEGKGRWLRTMHDIVLTARTARKLVCCNSKRWLSVHIPEGYWEIGALQQRCRTHGVCASLRSA